MATKFANYRAQNTLVRRDVAYGKTNLPPSMIRADITWGDYGAVSDDITILINLLQGTSPLDFISGVYFFSQDVISLTFPDTQFRISAFGSGGNPVMCNGLQCEVRNESVSALDSIATIYFTNMLVQPQATQFFF